MLRNRLHQLVLRLLGPCYDHEPRGVAVKAVYDAGPREMCVLRIAEEDAVHQRAVRDSRARMDDEPRGLVDDDDVLVLIDRLKGNILRLRKIVISCLGRQADFHAALHQSPRHCAAPAVKRHAAFLNPFLDLAARVIRIQGRENLIEPSSVLLIAGGPHQLLVFLIIEFL